MTVQVSYFEVSYVFFLFLRSYIQVLYILMAASPHTFWLNKLQGIIIKQERWNKIFSLFISMCVAGWLAAWCYIWQKISCEWIILQISLLFCFDFGIRQNGEVNVRTLAIRNRNPSYGYYLCCCCCFYCCCCLCGLIVILNSTGYFSHP